MIRRSRRPINAARFVTKLKCATRSDISAHRSAGQTIHWRFKVTGRDTGLRTEIGRRRSLKIGK